jgi:flagellar biosynthesis component FlhA
MNAGKEMCEVLKSMRKKLAEQYGLVYEPTECHSRR